MSLIVVTGASSGIGRGVAERLAGSGAQVVGLARRTDQMPRGIIRVPVDLGVAGAAHTLAQATGDAPVDGLVHCAGYGDFAPLELTPVADAQRQLQVNVLAAAELAQAVLPRMRAAGRGRIVLLSSVASRFSSPMGGWYHASKAALEAYADALRQEVSGFGVDVVVVQPGVVRTPWHATAMGTLVERTVGTPYEQAGAATAAYHRRSAGSATACEPDDVVDAVVEALTATRPRTRYLVGRGSRAATALPRLVPDRTFDRLTRRQFGITTR